MLGALQSYLDWDRVSEPAATAVPQSVLIISVTFSLVLAGTLALLVLRRRSKIAMWVLIALVVPGIPALVVQSITGEQPGSVIIIMALQEIAYVVALGLLFTPSARRWMNRKSVDHRQLR